MIPRFNRSGNLSVGIHVATWKQFVTRFGKNAHRRNLIAALKRAIIPLQHAGCQRIFIDGSFVTSKELPNDYDAAWDTTGVDLPLLLRLEPVFGDFSNARANQKAKFLGEFFPATLPEAVSGLTFLEFFQNDNRTGKKKGILALELGEFE